MRLDRGIPSPLAAARAARSPAAPGEEVGPARHAVLVMNPRSGGGRVGQVGLPEECAARGVEPVVQQPGDGLGELAEAALARGADVVGVAGGDGSLGTVAGVVAAAGAAMVVVPAGTRNHLAMDLGLDRQDVVGALDAFGAARERRMDLGEVNGRVFVNNASLGLYAQIIRSPEYRDAKVDTTLDALPRLLGPGSRPFALRFTGPAGEQRAAAHVVQVANNPYGRTLGSLVSRPRLDGGRLGIIAVLLANDPAVLRALLAGRPDRLPGFLSWEAESFRVDADGPVDVGVDGEALRISPPLRFTTRPGGLRIRVPLHAVGLSPAARNLQERSTLRRWQRR